MGNVGQAVFSIARNGFGLDVIANSRNPKSLPEGARFATVDQLVEESDIVVLCCPLTPETTGLLSRERIDRMKPGALLINVSRGPVVDDDALIEALGDGARMPVAVAAGALSLLMVSTVRYRTFKDARPGRKTALVFMAMALTGGFIAQQFHPAWVLVTYFFAYLVMGLVESAVSVRSRLVSRKVGTGAVAAVGLRPDPGDALGPP